MTMIASPTHLFDTDFDVKRPTDSVDSSGSSKSTFGAHLSSLKGRFQPMSGAENLRYGRESTRHMWRVYTAPGKDIQTTDRIEFVDRTTGSAVTRTLDIQERKNAQLFGVVLRLICQETS